MKNANTLCKASKTVINYCKNSLQVLYGVRYSILEQS